MLLARAALTALVAASLSIWPRLLEKVDAAPLNQGLDRLQRFNEAMNVRYGSDRKSKNAGEALKLFRKLAEGPRDSITVQCWYEMAKIQLFGVDSYFFWKKRDVAEAKELFLRAAQRDHAPSLFYSSFIYTLEGEGPITADAQKAGFYLKRAAKMGYVPAILSLAYRKLYGIGSPADIPYAISLYKKAYSGNGYRNNVLGYLIPSDDLVITPNSTQAFKATQDRNVQNDSQQKKDAIKYWETKAGAGDPLAMYEMAKLMEDDPAADETVAELYKSASKKGVVAATRDVGLCYLNGVGVPQNVEKAVEHLTVAAQQGDQEAAKFLGYVYYSGIANPQEGKPVARDLKLAAKYFAQAARHEMPEAMYFMGEIYNKNENNILGATTPKHASKALAMYAAAADYGLNHAFLKEAEMLENGSGVKQNITRAALNYKTLAESTFAANTLRDAFQAYMQKDYLSSFLHNAIAAYAGVQSAQFNLGQLYVDGKGLRHIQNADTLARSALVQNLRQGDVRSYRLLACIAEKEGQTKVAIELYTQGFKNGDIECLDPLVTLLGADNSTRDKAIALLEHKQYRKQHSADGSPSGVRNTLETMYTWFRIKVLKARKVIAKYTRRDDESL
ncbi:Sel1 repeat domain-containing protein [Babesia ovis]|uniref:Sel1 repeat domain-containing protein n=1 Tax=Babesia ovis TaxID=5869 RepID=A0A9W5WU24_BABOV|nr:Sel1 repeat domain-containing protein [Babesia ovis]